MLLANSWMVIFVIFDVAFPVHFYIFDGNPQNLQFTFGLHIYGVDHVEFWSGWNDLHSLERSLTIHISNYNCGFYFYIILVELFFQFQCFFRPIDVTTSLFDFHICLDGTNFYQISTSLDYMGCFGSHFIMGFICW